jgi:tRNA(Ile)-lysidine synthase
MEHTMETQRPSFELTVAAGLGNWPPGTVFLAAVSGGADSTAMLAALASLRRERGFRLHCLHVEHGIRPGEESRGDAEAVEGLCKTLEVPCRIISIAPGRIAGAAKARGLGIEGAARLYRHAAWNREALRIGAEKVLVAHTRDDLLETVLMRFLRGAGPRGLAAMPPSRGRVLRPLLSLGRAEALNYLAERGIPYRTDSTNEDIAYLRNRIRHKLIPQLDEFFPSWRKTVLALAETQGKAADFLETEAARRLAWRPSAAGEWTLPRETFFAQPEIIREEALFALADRIKKEEAKAKRGPGPDGPIKEAPPPRRSSLGLFAAGIPALDLGLMELRVRGDAVAAFPRRRRIYMEGFSLLIKEPGVYTLKGLRIEVCPASSQNRGGKNAFTAELPLVFRKALGDDCILYRGRKRRPAKLPNRQVPPEDREIITAEDAGGPAAFIGLSRNGSSILVCREEGNDESAKNGFLFSIMTTGGIDVQRSE